MNDNIFSKPLKKILASGLSLSIIVLAPGLLPYEALAANTVGEGGAGPIRVLPVINTPAGLDVNALKTTELAPSVQIPGAAQLPGAVVPEASAITPELSSPQAQEAQPQPITVIGGAENLATAVSPEAKPEAVAQETSLNNAYTGSHLSATAATDVAGKEETCSTGGCPFAKLFGKSKGGSNNGSADQPPQNQRPKPADVGIVHKAAMYAMAYTWWVWDRAIDSKWDKMPPTLAAIYLYFNEQYLRLHLWDAGAEPSTDKKVAGPATESQKKYRTADGSYFDLKDPDMAKAGSRFNQVRKPDGPPNPNFDKMDPNPFVISEKLQQRAHDAQGNPIIKEIPANYWFMQIQDQLHDWFNHEQRPLTDHPVSFTVPKGHPLKPEGGTVILNRTKIDDSVPADYQGAAIHRNAETSPWDKSSLYGSSAETQAKVRSFTGGHLKIGADGYLGDDPAKPGVPQTGFNNNMSVELSVHNNVWAHEHNFVADAINQEYKARGIQLSDEELFQKARLRIAAVNARNHTVPWTQWLFAGSKIGQNIMWADWYGFLGKRFKLSYMRFTDRHPKLAKFTDPLIRTELLFGIPGTDTTHYGKHYNFTEEFVDVYRMHQLIRDTLAVNHLTPNADGTVEISVIDSVKLRDRVGVHTQEILRSHSLEDWGLTMGREKVGELTINNVPDDLRNLTAQDGAKDGHKVDLGAIDIIRTRERLESSTYTKFTIRLGEKPPRTFEELTGGNKEAADKLREVYKKVEDVDMQIGILAERKPVGYALGNRQFKVFVLSAPARLKNDRFLSSEYNAKTYDQSGIDYNETNSFANIVARVMPGLKALDIEAMANPYMPYLEQGWLPKALADDSLAAQGKAAKSAAWSWGLAGAGIAGLALAGALSALPISATALALILGGTALERLTSSRELMSFSPSLSETKQLKIDADRGALFGKASAAVSLITTLGMAYALFAAAPIAAVALGIAGLIAAHSMSKNVAAMDAAVALQAVEIKARLRKDAPKIDPATLPGDNAIAKRYWFLLGDKNNPVATFKGSYKALRASGISVYGAFKLALLAHIVFPPKTQKFMTAEEKARWPVGRFDIFVPNMIDAHSYANTRTYMSREDAAALGLKPGDVNMVEFDRMFREFGGLRGYMTAYDFARMREANQWRDKTEGRGTVLQRIIGRWQAGRRAGDVLNVFADRVVWEDGLPGGRVPAISRERLLEFYQGVSQAELDRENEK